MTSPCEDVTAFADGEMSDDRAAAFREHLMTCDVCRLALVEAMQLDVRLGELGDRPPPRARRRWWPAAAAGVAVAAAGVVTVSLLASAPVAVVTVATTEDVIPVDQPRPSPVRLVWAGASTYHPEPEAMMGTAGATAVQIPGAVIARLEKIHDERGRALVTFLSGGRPADAAQRLRELETAQPSPALTSDRAAIELLATTNDNVEPVLRALERLQASPDLAVRRAAQWNYALALARLELPYAAADAFERIAKDGEPGWSKEAAERAKTLRLASSLQTAWARADTEGREMARSGLLISDASIAAAPGVARAHLYEAVRAAPSAARVRALRPVAEKLDARDGATLLTAYVDRVAGASFAARAPRAATYARLLAGERTTEAERARLTGGDDDLALGTLIELELEQPQLARFRSLARATRDPWFEIMLAKQEAGAAVARGDWQKAEARLHGIEPLCQGAVQYQCLAAANQLANLLADLHRIPEALQVVRAGVATARGRGEWGRYLQLLYRQADLERFNSSTALARAVAREVELNDPTSCGYRLASDRTRIGAAVIDTDAPAARAAFETALVRPCIAHDLPLANYQSDLMRLAPTPEDGPRLASWLPALRAAHASAPAELALIDELEGRAIVAAEPARGTQLLERAIAASRTSGDVMMAKVRAAASAVLAVEAVVHGDATGALARIAEELGAPLPEACAVGLVAETARRAVIVRGLDRRDRAATQPTAAASVPPELVRQLTGCPEVRVFAHAGLQGQPGVLPPALAWSYEVGRTGAVAPTGRGRPLIVAHVAAPAYLELPDLVGSPDAPPGATLVSGAAATVERVTAEMADASEIQFHTHALMDVGLSDASHLVLSPERGRYALTAEVIRTTTLRNHPVVVLAACQSARGASYEHAAWSLPDAFLAAGARAVFAAGTDIPDKGAATFFEDVLARVRAGATPATALRDARAAINKGAFGGWIASIVVFQ